MEEEKKPNLVEYFLMTVNIKVLRESCDLGETIKKISWALDSYSHHTKHRFKVTGEAKILALFRMGSVMQLEDMLSKLMLSAQVDVSCDLLVGSEDFGKMTGMKPLLTQYLVPDVMCLWAEFTVEYPGKFMDDLLSTWETEANAVLTSRQEGNMMELFKACGAKKVHVFIECTIKEWDELSCKLLLKTQNGNNVKIVTKRVLNLDTYKDRISDFL